MANFDTKQLSQGVYTFRQALQDLDFNAMEQCFTEDALYGQPGGSRMTGNKVIARHLRHLMIEQFQIVELHIEIIEHAVVGPYVVDDRFDCATFDIPGVGRKEIRVHAAGCYLVRDDRVAEWTEWVADESMAEIRNALGIAD